MSLSKLGNPGSLVASATKGRSMMCDRFNLQRCDRRRQWREVVKVKNVLHSAGGVRGAAGSGGRQVDPRLCVSGPDLRRQSSARSGHQQLPQGAGTTWQRP